MFGWLGGGTKNGLERGKKSRSREQVDEDEPHVKSRRVSPELVTARNAPAQVIFRDSGTQRPLSKRFAQWEPLEDRVERSSSLSREIHEICVVIDRSLKTSERKPDTGERLVFSFNPEKHSISIPRPPRQEAKPVFERPEIVAFRHDDKVSSDDEAESQNRTVLRRSSSRERQKAQSERKSPNSTNRPSRSSDRDPDHRQKKTETAEKKEEKEEPRHRRERREVEGDAKSERRPRHSPEHREHKERQSQETGWDWHRESGWNHRSEDSQRFQDRKDWNHEDRRDWNQGHRKDRNHEDRRDWNQGHRKDWNHEDQRVWNQGHRKDWNHEDQRDWNQGHRKDWNYEDQRDWNQGHRKDWNYEDRRDWNQGYRKDWNQGRHRDWNHEDRRDWNQAEDRRDWGHKEGRTDWHRDSGWNHSTRRSHLHDYRYDDSQRYQERGGWKPAHRRFSQSHAPDDSSRGDSALSPFFRQRPSLLGDGPAPSRYYQPRGPARRSRADDGPWLHDKFEELAAETGEQS